MRVIVLSAREVAEKWFKPEDFLISIRAPKQEPPPVRGTQKILWLCFKDDSKDFLIGSARLIIDMISKAASEGCETIYVNCDAGISRSAGVAAFLVAAGIAEWREEDDEVWSAEGGMMPRFQPNAHVKSLLMRAIRGEK